MFGREALSIPTCFVQYLATLFLSQLMASSLNPCVEEITNITYRCMALNLSGVPAEIPPSTQNLDLSFNPLESLTSNYFSAVPALRFLDLTRCHIQTIEDYAFEDLHNLLTLILTANPLWRLGPKAFYSLTSLQKLVAVEDNISSLADLPIGHLHTLQELNVAKNNVDSLKLPKYFSNLTFLQFLSLKSNKISSISIGDLDVLQGEKGLNLSLVLSINDIKYIQLGSFEGIHLHELSLRACFENTSVMKACIQGLAGLQVNRLVLGEFRNIARVEDFSNGLLDGLCQVQLQEFVFISFQRFYNCTDTLFDCLVNTSIIRLVDIYLNQVSAVPTASRIHQLECKTCKFSEVPALKLSFFKELRVLRITKSKYLTGFRQKFVDLPNLEVLDLSENRLSFIKCCSFYLDGTPNLKHLNLSFNSIISLSGGLPFNELVSLDFQHSKLDGLGTIPVFLSLGKLIYLDISYTNTHVESQYGFCGLESLQVLKMAGNSFKDNNLGDSFVNLTQLLTLDVSSCKLIQVSLSTFSSLGKLQKLNISHNKLLTFDHPAYKPLQALTVLDFSSNQLTVLKEKALENLLSSLVHLDLSHNLLDCSCNHLSFLKWAKEHGELLQRTELMVCNSPEHLKNASMLNFDLSSCQLSAVLVAVYGGTALAGVVFLILIYKYYFSLYYGLVLLSGCRRYADRDDTYDAFVIHSSKDIEWVRNELVETLERGVPPFHLCLHYRDFIPGVPVASNIIQEGFLSSRKVISVISNHFLESKWCSFEFEIAQSWQFVEGRAGIILIVLEEVDKALLRRKLGLSRYLKRNTYLEWKDREISRHLFWRQLRTALLDGKTEPGRRGN
ncbi:toll-like receptor 4 isoform X1 [Mauremys reevesii]|uniref:toll-like receptor 4 isoform X1 n=1 Tax=Mauremys reevesii TaxID=260615 RepID=UPI00193F926C|nr:toll-like receptor 4 isoform X1 [Mauremys reevesii]